jgi:cation diffusion facilitator CzcD-associated flavoprotein CzcO
MSPLNNIKITGATQVHNDVDIGGLDQSQVDKRYVEERAKRLRPEGNDQYVDISLSAKFQKFGEDPWVDVASIADIKTQFLHSRTQVLILGGGFSGLLYAVRMVEAGIRPEDLRIVESGGGFGGTWYYNRYPGLMCDIESYCYLPLLEETGYIPKHRYSSGEEIRNYANLIAEKYNIAHSAVFQTKAEKLEWDEEIKEWQVQLTQQRTGKPAQTLNIRSQFVAMVNGVLNWPKLPGLPGILNYQGEMFHTARWDYSVTGGSPIDASLEKLKDKRVAIIGTGATELFKLSHRSPAGQSSSMSSSVRHPQSSTATNARPISNGSKKKSRTAPAGSVHASGTSTSTSRLWRRPPSILSTMNGPAQSV